MQRVSAIVHCIAVIQYNHNRNRVSLYYLLKENKSFGTDCHLHSSSDVREVVSSTRLFTSTFLQRSSLKFLIDGIIVYKFKLGILPRS
jgi:hypothetical protein